MIPGESQIGMSCSPHNPSNLSLKIIILDIILDGIIEEGRFLTDHT